MEECSTLIKCKQRWGGGYDGTRCESMLARMKCTLPCNAGVLSLSIEMLLIWEAHGQEDATYDLCTLPHYEFLSAAHGSLPVSPDPSGQQAEVPPPRPKPCIFRVY